MESKPVEKLTVDNLHECFTYHPWEPEQEAIGAEIRMVLEEAARVALLSVPDCPDRSTGLRKLREARMDFNSAITHRGKF
jgi:hypothetical protein